MNSLKYVIIGNSAAAVGAVEAIRKNDTGGRIVIISNENHHTYSRPLISYLLMGKTDEEKMKYRDNDFYIENRSILDDEGSRIIENHLKKSNIEFYLGRQIVEFKENTAVLDSNIQIPFDVLVLAVGVKPNISLIKDIGGETNRGILTDERCRTSIPDIYAAGDCCESMDISSGVRKPMPLLPNAYMQGECAGMNMSGKDFVFDKAIPMNAIGLFGEHIITAGTYTGHVYCEADKNGFKKLFYSDNKLNGFIMIGNIEKAGIYTALIREKTPLDTLDFNLICKMPGLMAFSKEERASKLGGVLNESMR